MARRRTNNPARYKAARALYSERERKLAQRPDRQASARAGSKRWRAKYPEKNRAHTRKRRATVMGAPINDLTPEQWLAIQVAADHRCSYCHGRFKGRLTQDHIVPLSKGGSHTASNIAPSCKSCNCMKRAGKPPCPVQTLLLDCDAVARNQVSTPSVTEPSNSMARLPRQRPIKSWREREEDRWRRVDERMRRIYPGLVRRLDMTGPDRMWASEYEVGNVLRFSKGSKLGVKSGEIVCVTKIDSGINELTVERLDGSIFSYCARRLIGVHVYRKDGKS